MRMNSRKRSLKSALNQLKSHKNGPAHRLWNNSNSNQNNKLNELIYRAWKTIILNNKTNPKKIKLLFSVQSHLINLQKFSVQKKGCFPVKTHL